MELERQELERIEVELLIQAVRERHGLDLGGYARGSLRRRFRELCRKLGEPDYIALLRRLLYDDSSVQDLISALSVTVTELFRDPGFYKALREKVLPLLATYPFIRVWHAGCATGEEVYSMAILLHEAGLLERSQLYATDINEQSLHTAEEGIYPLERMTQYTRNYIAAGGENSLADYYTARYGYVRMAPFLRERMVFARHNLATDGVFTEAHLVLCRNVLIYFNLDLQNRALGLFHEALCPLGFLALGARESLLRTEWVGAFEELDREQRIFRRLS